MFRNNEERDWCVKRLVEMAERIRFRHAGERSATAEDAMEMAELFGNLDDWMMSLYGVCPTRWGNGEIVFTQSCDKCLERLVDITNRIRDRSFATVEDAEEMAELFVKLDYYMRESIDSPKRWSISI